MVGRGVTDHRITLVATCAEDDAAAKFRAEILKHAALYGVQVRELEVRPDREPRLRLVPPPDEAA